MSEIRGHLEGMPERLQRKRYSSDLDDASELSQELRRNALDRVVLPPIESVSCWCIRAWEGAALDFLSPSAIAAASLVIAVVGACRTSVDVRSVAPPAPVAAAPTPAALSRLAAYERPAPRSLLVVNAAGACAGFSSDDVACWGGSRAPSRLHVDGLAALSCAGAPCCALTRDGEIHCWDRYLWGPAARRWSPAGRDFRGVVVDSHHICTLDHNGAVACWHTFREPRPPPVRLLASGGGPMHTSWSVVCAVASRGSVRCWNLVPLLTDDPLGPAVTFRPRPDERLQDFVRVRIWRNHVCALSATGALWCGYNLNALMTGAPTVPMRRIFGEGHVMDFDVEARATHSDDDRLCAVDVDRVLRCTTTATQFFGGGDFTTVSTNVPATSELSCDGRACCVLDRERDRVMCIGNNGRGIVVPTRPAWEDIPWWVESGQR